MASNSECIDLILVSYCNFYLFFIWKNIFSKFHKLFGRFTPVCLTNLADISYIIKPRALPTKHHLYMPITLYMAGTENQSQTYRGFSFYNRTPLRPLSKAAADKFWEFIRTFLEILKKLAIVVGF